jgi:hypothetical protein
VRRAAFRGLVVAALALGGCGVKAPPRASGAPDQAPPNTVFKPAEDPNPASLELEKPAPEPTR